MSGKVMMIVGWVVTALIGAMLAMSAGMKFSRSTAVTDMFVGTFGYPEGTLLWIAVAEAVCVVLLVVPRTAVLGAVLTTGYLGGAIATHVRVGDPFVVPAVMGAAVWAALYLRDERLRALLPMRRKATAGAAR